MDKNHSDCNIYKRATAHWRRVHQTLAPGIPSCPGMPRSPYRQHNTHSIQCDAIQAEASSQEIQKETENLQKEHKLRSDQKLERLMYRCLAFGRQSIMELETGDCVSNLPCVLLQPYNKKISPKKLRSMKLLKPQN